MNLNDEPIEDPQQNPDEDLKEDLDMGQLEAKHDVEDIKSVMSADDTDSSFDSGKESRDMSDLDYNPYRDH